MPSIPDVFKSFTGPMMHTGEWDHEIELTNKKVAVIGTGASAIQVIPNIVDDVDSLHCYQRQPPYVLPRVQFTFPDIVKTIFFYVPIIMWLYRCLIYFLQEVTYIAFRHGSLLHSFGKR